MICTKCNIEQEANEFTKGKKACKRCRSAQWKQWVSAHYQQHLATKTAYRRSHRKEIAAYDKRHHAKRKEFYAQYGKKRLHMKQTNLGTHTESEWNTLKQQFNFSCACCGTSEPTIKLIADHVLPIMWGGDDFISNIQPLCGKCNSSKGSRYIDFREQHN